MTDKPMEKNGDTDQSPGLRLRAAREKLGLSTKDVANRLHLDVKHIESIEGDKSDDQIAPVFMRGYMRSYARLLSLQPDPIVDSYQTPDADTSSIFHGHSSASSVHSGDRPVRWIISIVILGLIVIPVLWWQTRESQRFWEIESGINLGDQAILDQPLDSTSTDTTVIPGVISSNRSEPSSTEQDSSIPTVEGNAVSSSGATNPLAPVPTDSQPSTVTENPPSLANGQPGVVSLPDTATTSSSSRIHASPVLSLQLSADSWVEVTDATDTQLIYSLLAEGNTRTLQGFKPPLRVLLGNAAGVTIEYNGQLFDHSSYQRNGLARFTLGEAIVPSAAE